MDTSMPNNIENEVERIVADLVERYKDPTQLNGTDYLFIPVDKIKHTLTTLTEQHQRELDIAFTKGEIAGLKRGQELALEALRKV